MLEFTRRETGVLIFLLAGFVIGSGIKLYQKNLAPLPIVEDISMSGQSFTTDTTMSHPLLDGKTEPLNQVILLNSANVEMLEKVPGIGPVTAERIIIYRSKYGRFQSLEEMKKIKGIGEKTFIKIKPYLAIN